MYTERYNTTASLGALTNCLGGVARCLGYMQRARGGLTGKSVTKIFSVTNRGEQTKNEMRICILFATIQTIVYWVLMAAQTNIRMSKICPTSHLTTFFL